MKFSYVFLFIFLFTSCKSIIKKELTVEGEAIKYATNFKIEKKGLFTFLKIINPETKQIEIEYFLKKEGQPNREDMATIEVPIKSIAALSSTHIGMLNKLNSLDNILVISDTNYISNKSIKGKCRSGHIKSIGGEGIESVEEIIYSKVNVVCYSGFGKPFPHQDKLKRLGINCIPNYDWREYHPLGKAEWIKLFGVLLGKEKEAFEYFEQVEKAYNNIVELAKGSISSPTVFSGSLLGDIWYAPAGESYNAKLYEDAHLNYIYKDSKGTGSLSKSFEEVLLENQNTEYWLNPNAVSFSNLLNIQPKMTYFKAVKNKKVYDYSSQMNFFWENSAIEPQKVLSDLITIFHPDLKSVDRLYFYQQLKD